MLGDLMTSTQPIEIKVFGDDQVKLQQLSKQVAAIVTNVKGTADVFDGIVIAGPSVNIVPDYSKLAQYNITPAALQTQVQSALEGNVIGNLFEREQQSPIRMVYPGNRLQDVAGIKRLNVFLPRWPAGPYYLAGHRKASHRRCRGRARKPAGHGRYQRPFRECDLGSVIPAIQKGIREKINLPPGYHVEYGGAYAEQQQSFKELLMILITASLLVFGVILFLFRQFRIALLILVIAVLGIGGSMLACS
jgi:Cu/Ag efflux pump CusA